VSQYPQDEFDVAGRERGPEGVHRQPPSLLRSLAPFIAVIVIVPLLAWGAVSLLGGGGGEDPQAEPTATATTEVTEEPTGETESPEGETPEGETPEGTPEEETTEPGLGEDVILGTSISVLNGAGVQGLAGQVAAELQEAGFTTVGAADYTAGSPDVTTLYYRNADLAATAEAIGELVGIDTLVEAPSATQNVEIAIVLRADYTAG